MRKINKIVVHCTAGNQSNTAKDVVHFHTGPKSRGCLGWSRPGYHYIIEADGKIVNTWPEESYSNGVKGHNADSINVCYIGGVDLSKPKPWPPIDNRTPAQKESLLKLLRLLKSKYPTATIYGHRDFAAKPCPCFDAKTEYKDI